MKDSINYSHRFSGVIFCDTADNVKLITTQSLHRVLTMTGGLREVSELINAHFYRFHNHFTAVKLFIFSSFDLENFNICKMDV